MPRNTLSDTLVNELRKIAGANMADYMKSTPSGDPYLDFSALTRSAAKGILDRMRAERGPTLFGGLKERLDNLSKLAKSLRSLASGEMERAKALLPVDELPPRE
jgi:hypothetical protein